MLSHTCWALQKDKTSKKEKPSQPYLWWLPMSWWHWWLHMHIGSQNMRHLQQWKLLGVERFSPSAVLCPCANVHIWHCNKSIQNQQNSSTIMVVNITRDKSYFWKRVPKETTYRLRWQKEAGHNSTKLCLEYFRT